MGTFDIRVLVGVGAHMGEVCLRELTNLALHYLVWNRGWILAGSTPGGKHLIRCAECQASGSTRGGKGKGIEA